MARWLNESIAACRYYAVAICIFFSFFSSCRRPKELVYQDVENFRLQRTSLAFDVRLYNPNNLKVKLKKADLDVFLEGRHAGAVKMKEAVMIEKLDTFLLPVILDVDMANVLPNALQLLTKPEVTLKVSGTAKAGRHGIFIPIPVRYEGKQRVW